MLGSRAFLKRRHGSAHERNDLFSIIGIFPTVAGYEGFAVVQFVSIGHSVFRRPQAGRWPQYPPVAFTQTDGVVP